MPAGYGSDATSSSTDPSTGQSIAASIAQIFSTGVTAYVDSQAVQNGYTINDPRYFQAGYPAGYGTPYGQLPAGAGVSLKASGSNVWLLVGLGLVAFLLLRR